MEIFELFKTFGITAIIVTGSVWLLRKITEQLLARDIEKFKSDLEKQTIEFRIRYERLHSERVEVIKEVYKRISRTYKSFSSLMNPLQLAQEPAQEEKGQYAAKNANDLTDYYEENRIFFDEKLAKNIDLLLLNFREAWAEFEASRISKGLKDHKTALSQWNSAWKKIQDETPKVKVQLENKFRSILGIQNE